MRDLNEGRLNLKGIDDKNAFDWYKRQVFFGDKAFGSVTFAGITQHTARYALIKVGSLP